MKEKPIIFSGPMVQAILEGRKTMTRRAITVPWCKGMRSMPYEPYYVETDGRLLYMDECGEYHPMENKCPYGKPGTRLWVRETWRIGAWCEDTGEICVDYKAGHFIRKDWIKIEDEKRFKKYWVESFEQAEDAGLLLDEDGQYHWEPGQAPTKWRPSRFMPKAVARIWLEVTNVRVERLQEITEEDAVCEGCEAGYESSGDGKFEDVLEREWTAKEDFADLWDSLNAKRGYGWDMNPWVWVIELRKVSP